MNEVLEIAVNNAITVAPLAVVVVAIRLARANPAVVHGLCVLLLLKLVTPPFIPFAVAPTHVGAGQGADVASALDPLAAAPTGAVSAADNPVARRTTAVAPDLIATNRVDTNLSRPEDSVEAWYTPTTDAPDSPITEFSISTGPDDGVPINTLSTAAGTTGPTPGRMGPPAGWLEATPPPVVQQRATPSIGSLPAQTQDRAVASRFDVTPFRALRDPGAGSDTSIPALARIYASEATPCVAAFGADGATLIVGDQSGTLLLYDLRTGSKTGFVETGRPDLSRLAVSPTGQDIALGWSDGDVRVWSPSGDNKLRELAGVAGRLVSLVFAVDGRRLLTGSISPEGAAVVTTWNARSHRPVGRFRCPQPDVEQLTISADGQLMATAGRASPSALDVRTWDIASATSLRQFTVPASDESTGVTCLEFSPDNSLLMLTDQQQRLLAWKHASGVSLPPISTDSVVKALALHPDQRHVGLLQADGTLEVWNLPDGTCRARFGSHFEAAPSPAHGADDACAVFSPDGSILASLTASPVVQLWTLAVDCQTGTIPAADYAFSVEVTPDGDHVIIGGSSGATLRRLENGHLVHHLQKRDPQANEYDQEPETAVAVAVSHDGRTAITGGHQQELHVWDLESGRLRFRLDGHTRTVRSVAFSPDGQTALSGAYDGQAILWDLKNSVVRHRLAGDGSRVSSVAISPDGRQAAVGSTMTVRMFDMATGEQQQKLSPGSPVASLCFSADGTRLLSAHNDASLRIWDARDGTQQQQLDGHTRPLESASFSPDGRFAASGGQDHRLLLWDLQHPQSCLELGLLDTTIKSVRFSHDGRQLITAGADGNARIWDLTDAGRVRSLADRVRRWAVGRDGHSVSRQEPRHTLRANEGQTSFVQFSPDGRTFATAGSDRIVRLYDITTHQLRAELTGHEAGITSGAYFPDGRRLATAAWAPENAVRIWDVTTQSEVALLKGHAGPIRMVAVSRDGSLLATASEDRTVILWDAQTYEELQSLPEQPLPVFSLALGADGHTLAIGTGDLDPYQAGEVTLWDTRDGRRLRRVEGFDALQRSVGFSPDGTALIAKKSENTLSSIDVSTLRNRWDISAAAGPLAIARDGQTIASGQLDGSVRLWDAHDGHLLADLRRHQSHVRAISFSPDGRMLASAGLDGTVMLWDVPKRPDTDPRNRFIADSNIWTSSPLGRLDSPDAP